MLFTLPPSLGTKKMPPLLHEHLAFQVREARCGADSVRGGSEFFCVICLQVCLVSASIRYAVLCFFVCQSLLAGYQFATRFAFVVHLLFFIVITLQLFSYLVLLCRLAVRKARKKKSPSDLNLSVLRRNRSLQNRKPAPKVKNKSNDQKPTA